MSRGVRGKFVGVVALGMMLTLSACMGRYALDRKPVKQISEAERKSRGRSAFERARERVRDVREGMSPAEVQVALGAVIAVEEGLGGEKGDQRKLMDGFLCKFKINPYPLSVAVASTPLRLHSFDAKFFHVNLHRFFPFGNKFGNYLFKPLSIPLVYNRPPLSST